MWRIKCVLPYFSKSIFCSNIVVKEKPKTNKKNVDMYYTFTGIISRL